MTKLETIELQEIELNEIICYSKKQNSPLITILDELTASQFNYVVAYADLLKLVYFMIKDTKKIAFMGNAYIVLKIAKNIQVKAQVMYYYTPSYKSVLKSNLTPKHNRSAYIVKAYDRNGNKTKAFIDTNIQSVSCDNLDKYEYHDFKYNVVPRNYNNNTIDIKEIMKLRKEYLSTDY